MFIKVNFVCITIGGQFNPPGGGFSYERDGDARRKIRIKPLKKTNLGVAQALFGL